MIIPKTWQEKAAIIKVVGVGGGGNNAVTNMYKQEIQFVDFVICNTDVQALDMSPVPTKLQLGALLTKGLGAGTDPEVGKKAAKESEEEINEMLGENTEMVFITCGMGGGTGTGAAPVIAEAAKKKGLLTVGVVTIPFRDEGNEALFRAVEGIKELSKYVDSLLIIDNQKLYNVFSEIDMFTGFPKADEVLTTAVKSIVEIITSTGYINTDFADVKKIMKNSGMAIMGTGTASGANRALEAVEMAFKSPLLNECDISTTKNVLVNITSSGEAGKALRFDELSQIMDYVKEHTGNVINSKRGIVRDDSLGESISITIIATGFEKGQLPVINEDMINNDNKIQVIYSENVNYKKSGVPLHPDRQTEITPKWNRNGKPSLITNDPKEIVRLETEPAIERRDRAVVVPKTEQIEPEL